MSSDAAALVTCYNKGCGQKFDPNDNGEGKCIYHSGAPIFHDAYKGWSCCNKKSTDFTEFLNFKGCTQGKHSNEKPVEPEKNNFVDEDVQVVAVEERKPINVMKRPSFDSMCTQVEPIVNAAFKKQMDELDVSKFNIKINEAEGVIQVGTTCKNGGCGQAYESTASNNTSCVYHPGVPVFHEGYKFWSCCKRKTSDFATFLEQKGCETGTHKWTGEGAAIDKVNCRWDWHQTASNVVVAIYAKSYDYKKSFVKVNPIRLIVKIVFPHQKGSEFNMDAELRGIIKASEVEVRMFGTKIEVILPKAEAGHWIKFECPREQTNNIKEEEISKTVENVNEDEEGNDSDVDLDDLEPVMGARISEFASAQIN